MACKYMLINMRSKLSRPDLQILINSICGACIEYHFNIWMDWISTKDNYTADNLSRNINNPFDKCDIIPNPYPLSKAKYWLQEGANLCQDIIPTKDLVWKDNEA